MLIVHKNTVGGEIWCSFLSTHTFLLGNGQTYATRGVPYFRVSRIFMSRIFHPCNLVPKIHVSHFPPLHSGAAFSCPTISCLAFSASPFYISQLFRFLARTAGRPVYDDCSVHRFSRCAFIALSIFNHSSTKTLLSAVTTDTTVPIRPVVSVVGPLNTDIHTL